MGQASSSQLNSLSPGILCFLIVQFTLYKCQASKSDIFPITDWQEKRPGFVEVDLVAHCGESVDGFYLNTLMAVDVATGWSEFIGVWGKGQQRVGAAIHNVQQRLPFRSYSGWTQTTAASSSIRISPGGVIMKVLPSPGPGLIRKMIIVLLNRRTGLLCAGSSVEIVTAQNSLTKHSTESIIYYACISISFSRR